MRRPARPSTSAGTTCPPIRRIASTPSVPTAVSHLPPTASFSRPPRPETSRPNCCSARIITTLHRRHWYTRASVSSTPATDPSQRGNMPEPAPARHPAAIDHARDVCDTESGPSAPVVGAAGSQTSITELTSLGARRSDAGAWVPRLHRSIAGLGSLSDATIERIARDLVRELVPPATLTLKGSSGRMSNKRSATCAGRSVSKPFQRWPPDSYNTACPANPSPRPRDDQPTERAGPAGPGCLLRPKVRGPKIDPVGCEKSACYGFGMIMSRVAATALPDPGPANRLARPAGQVHCVEGRRTARPAPRGRGVATNQPEASAELV